MKKLEVMSETPHFSFQSLTIVPYDRVFHDQVSQDQVSHDQASHDKVSHNRAFSNSSLRPWSANSWPESIFQESSLLQSEMQYRNFAYVTEPLATLKLCLWLGCYTSSNLSLIPFRLSVSPSIPGPGVIL